MKLNSTELLKDYFNDSIDINKSYTDAELLTLCLFNYSDVNYIFTHIARYSPKLQSNISKECIGNAYKSISKWNDASVVYDKLCQLSNIFDVDIQELFESCPMMCVELLKARHIIRDNISIKLLDVITDLKGDKRYIFCINGKRYCMASEIEYDHDLKTYFYRHEGIIFQHDKHYMLINVGTKYDVDVIECYCGFSPTQRSLTTNRNYDNMSEFDVYEFNTQDDMHSASKIYSQNIYLFNKLYVNHLAKTYPHIYIKYNYNTH